MTDQEIKARTALATITASTGFYVAALGLAVFFSVAGLLWISEHYK